jgi:hypothetical protein
MPFPWGKRVQKALRCPLRRTDTDEHGPSRTGTDFLNATVFVRACPCPSVFPQC